MKRFCVLIVFALLELAFFISHAADADNFVACLGKVVPEDRIAKLSAVLPGGQAVVSKLYVKRGSEVKEGQPIAELAGLARANAEVERAKKTLASAKLAADMKILQQKNMIADLEGSYGQNKKVLDEESPSRRERAEIEYEQEALLRRIAQARAMLVLVEASQKAQVDECEAALKIAEETAAEYTVRSPINGIVVETNMRRGEAVGMDGICEIADTSKMYVEAEVYVTDVNKIAVGAKAEIFGDLLGDKKFAGKVAEISKYVKANKVFSSDPTQYTNLRVVLVKIVLDDSSAFKNYIGSQVNVRISAK